METLKCCISLYGYVMFLFLTTLSTGSACEAPSSPQCFRKNVAATEYMCEWSMNTTESDVTFDLYIECFHSKKKFRGIKKTWLEITEEELIKSRPVNISVEAHEGSSSCTSPIRTVVLQHTVKYEVPQNISVSWSTNNLSLIWNAAEKHPAAAEVWFRPDERPTESWGRILTNATYRYTTYKTLVYQVTVVNLLKHTPYHVRIRHRSTQALNSLWSNWSPVVMVPTEIEHEPEVNMTTTHLNGTRKVTLTWKPMPHAAAIGGVTYILNDTQSSHGCPCVKKHLHNVTKHTADMYVSYSAVNISVIARNAAGYSRPAIIQVPAKPPADLKTCDQTLVKNTKNCQEWYELQDGESRPENVITLTAKTEEKHREEIKNIQLKDYIRYLYFEHKCEARKPQTVTMCLFYKKEGAPCEKPQDFIAFSETGSSANLSWRAIPLVNQRGFLTHYRLCSMKINPGDEPKDLVSSDCHNISATLTKYHLGNLTPGSKYNVSLAGVTRVGEGPEATVTIITLPETPVNVWLSLGLLIVFFLITILCAIILKRIKTNILPPVPTPVILDFEPYQPESQMVEGKEEVHELMLLRQHPEGKSVSVDAEGTTVLQEEWGDGTAEDVENERGDSSMSGGSSDESLDSTDEVPKSSREEEIIDLEAVENEIAMLIYRNGLVFDLKTDMT
uniref:uncharacterized protein il12rb1 isoform X2 n=1 Tax=Monopterus albus TaxID=43700 RepID=UPI0009B4E036|nr:uncharacterized protein LOC109966833 isoform X2 [Monopterus albus]